MARDLTRRVLVAVVVSVVAVIGSGLAAASASVGAFTPTGSMHLPRAFHSATLLHDGRVLAAGGFAGQYGPPFITSQAELYDRHAGAWTVTTPMHRTRAAAMASILKDGRVLVAAGITALLPPAPGQERPPELLTNSAEVYDPNTGQWALTAPMNLARGDGTATLLQDGNVLVAGGESCSGDNCQSTGTTNTAELYNPKTNSWTWTGRMSEARVDHTATGLANSHGGGGGTGRAGFFFGGARLVLVAGGSNDVARALNTAEIYDSHSGTWRLTGSMVHRRVDQSAALVKNEQEVLVSGGAALVAGVPQVYSTSAEVYDIRSGTWRDTAPMNQPRNDHSLTVLKDGRVLAVGGHAHPETPQNTAEIYDPDTETWTEIVPATSSIRAGHTGNLLKNGEVLIAGGLFAPHLSTQTADLYLPHGE